MKELWADIMGYEGYQVSNLGRLRSLDRWVSDGRGNYLIKGRTIKSVKQNNGYMTLCVSFAQKKKLLLVHRLVAEHFIPNPEKSPEVNHKDRDRSNNRKDNLEWTSKRENRTHSKLNTRKSSEYSGLTFRKDSNRWRVRLCLDGKIKTIGNFDSEVEAAQAYFTALKEHGLVNKYAKAA